MVFHGKIAMGSPLRELSAEDKEHIMLLFFDEMVPRLLRAGARIGALNCTFAGEAYRNWNLLFSSAGSTFQLDGFEYDETACEFSLDL